MSNINFRNQGGYRGPSKLDILKNKIIENVKKANFSKEEGGGIANLPVMTKSSAVAKALGKLAILATADINRLKNAVLNLQRINQNLRQRMYKIRFFCSKVNRTPLKIVQSFGVLCFLDMEKKALLL